MNSIVTQLKKFSARITTAAGDVSAVPGQSIAEVLDFTQKNLNVDGSGALIVSELVRPGNYLKKAVTLNGQGAVEIEVTQPLNLVENEGTYLYTGYYGASNTPVELETTHIGDVGAGRVEAYLTINGISDLSGSFGAYLDANSGKHYIFCEGLYSGAPLTITGLYKIA